jgi:hypothetical protein
MYKLIHIFNRCGWAEWVSVDTLRLMSATQIKSEKTFRLNRDKLIEADLIEYRRGKKEFPSRYKISEKVLNDFETKYKAKFTADLTTNSISDITDNVTGNITDDSFSRAKFTANSTVNSTSNITGNVTANMGGNPPHIYKQKQRQKQKYTSKTPNGVSVLCADSHASKNAYDFGYTCCNFFHIVLEFDLLNTDSKIFSAALIFEHKQKISTAALSSSIFGFDGAILIFESS